MAVLLLAVAPLAAGQDPPGEGWEKLREKDGVTLYERPVPDSDVRESFATVAVEQPPQRVWRALTDYESFPEWSPYTEETRVVGREAGVDYVFQRMDLPWPAGNRYYTLRFERTESAKADGAYTLSWDLAGPPQRVECDCGVAMPVNRGRWALEPRDGGRATLVSCQVLSDPGGRLPKWAVRSANGRVVPRLMAALRERAALSRYAEDRPEEAP